MAVPKVNERGRGPAPQGPLSPPNGSSSSSNGTGSVQEARQQQWEELTVSMQGQSENSGTRGLAAMLEWTKLPANHVNEVLACNFDVMKVLGDRVLRPFLQDTIQLVPLSLSMVGMMAANPVAISRVLLQVGPRTLELVLPLLRPGVLHGHAHPAHACQGGRAW
eukprot:CAMPEP_0202356744 /NCGR_PEP_ID=MMETSP1126-20121109/11068_1 /ASSEMBLY_ACC=CAM_ASM_000457 /TAXON_ID=3047 /ORGANISM="Dunaliella tertiolecta, Strain CCMP1320" /LENGTH=163 /DNA_ID=CAMNT_0048949525 /DNA_START=112 /DNA_END=603 /DNA_ORIENTATION=+